MEAMCEDDRKIKQIVFSDGSEIILNDMVERIEPYKEMDSMGYHIWFAIYVDGKITQRVNSSSLECVVYL